MIVKMTNKEEKFYLYMGKFFGSRLIERQTNDRIYDDDNKQWYIYLEEEKVVGFVSVHKNVIKNIYTRKEKYLTELFEVINQENNITYSIVTKAYIDIYEKCGFSVNKSQDYKNFVTIYKEERI